MIISVNWLKQFTHVDMPIHELVELIGSRLVEVEEVIDLGAKYQGVVIADVMHIEKHPNADKLHVVHIDDGGSTPNVKRLENGLVEVVCGAPNVRPGIKVAWIPPGAMVPSTHGNENFVLEARPLRGVVSNGMLASAKELAVGDDHNGIVEIDKDVLPGTPFAAAYELDDYLLDIENKSLTHRPDCFGLIGFAREVAAISGKQFTSPGWLMAVEPILASLVTKGDPMKISARIDNPELSKRYQLVALDNVDATLESPFAIKTWLTRVGIRPISAVVDITNYLMYLTGQPLHAFDLDAVIAEHPEAKPEIVVRESREGETLTLLDGRTITLSNEDIVICAGDKPIGLAGAMGGASTEVTSTTKRVLLECATFDLYRLRTTQMRHAIYSEAITRFTKGQSPVQTAPILASAIRMLNDIVDAKRITEVIDEYPGKSDQPTITVDSSKINKILGSQASTTVMADTLRHTEFTVEIDQNTLKVTPPYWRGDIHIDEDIAEEIGRINGFDTVQAVLPLRRAKAVSPSSFDKTRAFVRQTLTRAGANEVLTYNFISSNLLRKTGEPTDVAYRLVNSISPELEYLRVSLLPSLLAKVHPNHKLGFDTFALYEMNKTHSKQELDDQALPIERDMLALVWSAADKKSSARTGAAFYEAKAFIETLAKRLQVEVTYAPLDSATIPAWLELRAHVFEPKRSALMLVGDQPVGIIGEITETVRTNLKLPTRIAGCELDLGLLHQQRKTTSFYTPISKFPGTNKDITLRVADDIAYAHIENVIKDVLQDVELDTSLTPISIYKNEEAAGHKQVTVRLKMVNHERTLTTEEANQVVGRIAEAAESGLQAEVI